MRGSPAVAAVSWLPGNTLGKRGDEKHFGNSEIQKAMAFFKKVPAEATFEDLVGQESPTEDPMEVEQLPFAVLISRKAWACRTTEPKFEGIRYPYRSSWGYVGGQWKSLEKEVAWTSLEDPHAVIEGGPVAVLLTVFRSRTRKEICQEDVPVAMRKRKEQRVHAVQTEGMKSKTKLRRMMEKEIPFEKIDPEDKELYKAAEEKEWASWKEYDSCEILSPETTLASSKRNPTEFFPADMSSGTNTQEYWILKEELCRSRPKHGFFSRAICVRPQLWTVAG